MKVIININKSNVRIEGLTEETRKLIWNELAFKVKDCEFMPLYRKGFWDGYIRLSQLNYNNIYFKLGLLYRVLNLLKEEGVDFKIQDTRNLPTKYNLAPIYQKYMLKGKLWPLREEQAIAVKKFIAMKLDNTSIFGRGIEVFPPRMGKSLTEGVKAKTLNAYPFLFIVNQIDLAYQTQEVFEAIFDQPIGIIADGQTNVNSPIVISTIQSIYKAFNIRVDGTIEREVNGKKISFKAGGKLFDEDEKISKAELIRNFINKVKTVSIDEAHHSASMQFQELMNVLENADYITGCTGTPDNDQGNEMLIEQLCGPVYYTLTPEYCVEKKYILPGKAIMIELPTVKTSGDDFQTIRKEAVRENKRIDTETRNVVRKLQNDLKSSVIMVSTKSQGKRVSELLNVPFLHGGIKGVERKNVYKRLEKKNILTIVSTVTDEGVDITSLDACIVIDIVKSKIKIRQRWRCRTPHKNKKIGLMFYIYPNNDYIRKHANIVRNVFKKDKTIKIKEYKV